MLYPKRAEIFSVAAIKYPAELLAASRAPVCIRNAQEFVSVAAIKYPTAGRTRAMNVASGTLAAGRTRAMNVASGILFSFFFF